MGKGLGRGLWKKGGTWMRFAVCDDNAADRRQLLSMLQQYCGNHRVQAEIQPFADGRALLQAFAPGKFQILFLDIYMPALTGMEGTTTTFEISGPQVTLRRTGSVNSQMVFEEGRQHTSLYETPFGELSVDIQTSALRHNLTERGGLLEIKYSIAVEHTVTGRNSFKIRVKRK